MNQDQTQSLVAEPGDLGTRILVGSGVLVGPANVLCTWIAGRQLVVGRLPLQGRSSRHAAELQTDQIPWTGRIIITSAAIISHNGAIWVLCLHCRDLHPLHAVGLRNMGDSTIRNQPRCGRCRVAPYRERSGSLAHDEIALLVRRRASSDS